MTNENTATVIVSGPMLRQEFHPCDLPYIDGVCRGRCCEGTGRLLVTVHPSEAARIEQLGATVRDGFIVPDDRGLCPFKAGNGLCIIHGPEKPFGCQFSPFTLNSNGTLVVRNRYRCLRCYRAVGAIPAYDAHRWSLLRLFGEAEAARIAWNAASGELRIPATMPELHYRVLRANDRAKHAEYQRSLL